MCVAATPRASLRVVERAPPQSWAEAFARALEQRSPERVSVLSMPLLASHCAEVQDIGGLQALAHAHAAWLLVDASQAVGQMPVSLAQTGADAIYFPARKWLRGPRGVAALVLSPRALDGLGAPAWPNIQGSHWAQEPADGHWRLDRGPGANRFQRYGQHPALVLGLGAAVDALASLGIEHVQARILDRAHALRNAVSAVPGLSVADAGGSGTVFMRVDQGKAGAAQAAADSLWQQGINVAAVSARYAPLYLARQPSVLRLSAHAFTTDEEIRYAGQALEQTIVDAGKGRSPDPLRQL